LLWLVWLLPPGYFLRASIKGSRFTFSTFLVLIQQSQETGRVVRRWWQLQQSAQKLVRAAVVPVATQQKDGREKVERT